jgi:2-dehydro-3-deoxyphosphogalactonate aldolase
MQLPTSSASNPETGIEMQPLSKFEHAMRNTPLVAILRGLNPAAAEQVGQALADAGFLIIEVPLNSPAPLDSIALLAARFPRLLVGAGTVLTVDQVHEVHAAGGQLIVAPNFNPEVVRAATGLGMVCLPGVMTPTEAFAALDAGAHGLKLFPAEMVGPSGLKAMRAVLPPEAAMIPVGGITPDNMRVYREAGATGFGIGSALYRPGMATAQVRQEADRFIAACKTVPPLTSTGSAR